ncbi:hypothetical protein E8L99_20760 [Phreatobacter aquaticus]|uniref:DUF1795 domain-containing protein n=1 Tax=Phreatobacter aquaticus TaxID=2570229 RepID=A0A4D7QK00_9HYPH|nr:hypothetical protein [Phreatobacter aquaticus]QCK88010.1 hypothetical protein E8L99_20760 [Phreatobacter aquaticus]
MRRIAPPKFTLQILALLVVAFASLPALAQGIAVTPEGWQRNVAETGTVFYRCQAATCATNSVVSYRQQRDGPMMSFESFERSNALTNQRMVEQSNGNLRAVEVVEIGQRTVRDTTIFTTVKLIRRTNGSEQYYIATLFSDGRRSFSVVSSADRERDARANMDQFLPVVMLVAQMP